MNNMIKERAIKISEPTQIGSYKKEDCIFLLKNLNGMLEENTNEIREKMNQSGVHYSESLPVEYVPSPEYVDLFHKTLEESSKRLAEYVGVVSETILKERGNNVVLVSLARAGSPIGVLIKRYIKEKYSIDLPHYSISIIRGKGFDENALCYIINKHNTDNLQWIDGWTGKGAINKELNEACEYFNSKYNVNLNPVLAVLADPAKCVPIYGTREDFLIPSACLNSTVSGLTTRSVERKDLIGEYEFHGAKYYDHWKDIDLSNLYVDKISEHFKDISLNGNFTSSNDIPNSGIKEVQQIMSDFNISNIHHVKPSIGECTRSILRRIPDRLLVRDLNSPDIKHLLILARDRNVLVEEYKNMSYLACGIIKEMNNSME